MTFSEIANRFPKDFVFGISKLRAAYPFIRKNELWKGMDKYPWAISLLILIGMIVGIKFLTICFGWWGNLESTEPMAVASSLAGLFGDIFSEGYQLFFLGGVKYIILILMEVIIFHFIRKTIQTLTGEVQSSTLQDFINAEIRMIKVVIMAWFLETIIAFAIKIFLGIVGYDFLIPFAILTVQCYFLGYVVLDNYFEVIGKNIKESTQEIKKYAGLSTSVGVAMYILLFIPLLGAILAPVIGSVAASLALHERLAEDVIVVMD
ncbi:MAG: EI24 domain-containing protein [Bacteroidota bacterium]